MAFPPLLDIIMNKLEMAVWKTFRDLYFPFGLPDTAAGMRGPAKGGTEKYVRQKNNRIIAFVGGVLSAGCGTGDQGSRNSTEEPACES